MDHDEFASGWAAAEQPFTDSGYRGAGNPGAIRLAAGHSILICSPHALHHQQAGQAKKVEPGTGGLALTLAAATGATALTPAGPIGNSDHWDDRDDEFAEALRRLIPVHRLIVDLHGMSDVHGFDICISFGSGISTRPMAAAGRVLRHLRGFRVGVSTPFTGKPGHTVTALARSLGVPCLQVELSPEMRRAHSTAGPALAAAIHDLIRMQSF